MKSRQGKFETKGLLFRVRKDSESVLEKFERSDNNENDVTPVEWKRNPCHVLSTINEQKHGANS